MGGRGSSSGTSAKGRKYGTEYRTLHQLGNVKFIEKTSNDSDEPLETMTNGRVYATVKNGDIKSINYYDGSNKRMKSINLDHYHKGLKPHVHRGYYHNESDPSDNRLALTQKEMKLVDAVTKSWDSVKDGL